MSTSTDCNCSLFDKPTYHAHDNPHSVEKKWHCPVHGMQQRHWLIHETYQEYCVPCNQGRTKDVYLTTKLNKGTKGESVRTMLFNKGGIHVALDFNKAREVIGIEVLEVKSVAINGRQV